MISFCHEQVLRGHLTIRYFPCVSCQTSPSILISCLHRALSLPAAQDCGPGGLWCSDASRRQTAHLSVAEASSREVVLDLCLGRSVVPSFRHLFYFQSFLPSPSFRDPTYNLTSVYIVPFQLPTATLTKFIYLT